jgi:hypothetical protein
MTTAAEYKQGATWRLCVYGRPKVGKSALVGQLAELFKLHWFDLEDGVKTLLNPQLITPALLNNIELFPIQTSQQNPLSVETLLKVTKGTACNICYKHGKVECQACKKDNATINRICLNEFTTNDMLVIDSTTQLSVDANFAVNPVIRQANMPEDFVLDKDTGGKNFKYPMAVSFILDRIFGTIQTLKINCAIISHEIMTEQTKDTGKVVGAGENQPSMGGEVIFPAAGSRNFSRSYGKYFDAIIHVDVINRKHVANSSSVYSGNYQTGSRMPYNIEDMKDAKGNVLPPQQAIVEMFRRVKSVTKA